MCVHICVVCMCAYIFACMYPCTWRPLVDFGSLGFFFDQFQLYMLRTSLSLSPELHDLVSVAGPLAPGASWVVLALAGITGRLSPDFFHGARNQNSPDLHICRASPWLTPYTFKGATFIPTPVASSELYWDRSSLKMAFLGLILFVCLLFLFLF